MFPDSVFQQSTKLRNGHAAFGYGFVNRGETRTNQVPNGVNHGLIALIISQSYCRHSFLNRFRCKSNIIF